MTTFGIELEFLLISRLQGSQAQPIEDVLKKLQGPQAQPIEVVLKKLLSRPFATKCQLEGCSTMHNHSLKVSSQQLKVDKWTVDCDASVWLSVKEMALVPGYGTSWMAYGAEVRSPAFSINGELPKGGKNAGLASNHDPWFSPSWEIHRALQLINDVNKPEKVDGNLRAFTNNNCALQVHVGNGVPSKGFDLDVVKKLIGLVTIFERQFDSIHDITRIGGSPLAIQPLGPDTNPFELLDDTPRFAKPLSVCHARRTYRTVELSNANPSVVAAKGGLGRPQPGSDQYPYYRYEQDPSLRRVGSTQNAIAWEKMVQNTQSIRDAMDMWHVPMKETTLNIEGLGPAHSMNTIEFRQHAGTLEYGEVMAWVNTVIKLVHWCSRASQTEYRSLIDSRWADHSFTIVDLLKRVVPPDKIESFKSTLNHYTIILEPGYPDRRYEEAMRIERLHGQSQGIDLSGLVQRIETTRRENRQSTLVKNYVKIKLLAGGYGKYPAEALNHLGDVAGRQKITI